MILPDELMHKIMKFLDVHVYATCALVSPAWESFTRTEFAYKVICERLYLNQSKRKILNLHRWKSYHNMLLNRPRVQTGGGVYVLKYSQVKQIQRDMWTEVPLGAILETVYYRYLHFCENGTVMYALTPLGPHEMIPKLLKMKQMGSPDKRIVIGRYEVCKTIVRVWAELEWCHILFGMNIITDAEQCLGGGRFSKLSLLKHQTSSTDFDDPHDVVDFEVPSEPFRFLFDSRL